MITTTLHAYDASLDHAHTIVHMLDDLEGSVEAGGSGEGFRKGFVPLMSVDYLKHPVLTIWLSGGAD